MLTAVLSDCSIDVTKAESSRTEMACDITHTLSPKWTAPKLFIAHHTEKLASSAPFPNASILALHCHIKSF